MNIDCPLQKNKPLIYPLDFSSIRKDNSRLSHISQPRYDYLPEHINNLTQKNNKKQQIDQLNPEQIYQQEQKLQKEKNIMNKKMQKDKTNLCKQHNNIKNQQNNLFDMDQKQRTLDPDQPLKEIKRISILNNFDETLLKNPKIQLLQNKQLKTQQQISQYQTIQTPTSPTSPSPNQNIISNNQNKNIHQSYNRNHIPGEIKNQSFIKQHDFNIKNSKNNIQNNNKSNPIKSNKQIPLNPELPTQLSYTNRQRLLKRWQSHKNKQKSQRLQHSPMSSYLNQKSIFNHDHQKYKDNISGVRNLSQREYKLGNSHLFYSKNKQYKNLQNLPSVRSSFELNSQSRNNIIYFNTNNFPNSEQQAKNSKIMQILTKNTSNKNRLNYYLQSKFSKRQAIDQRLDSCNMKSELKSHMEKSSQNKFMQGKDVQSLKSHINKIANSRLHNRHSYRSQFKNYTFQDQQKVDQPHMKELVSTQIQSKNHKKLQSPPHKSKPYIRKHPIQKLQISYHISLSTLKQTINKYLTNPQHYGLAFKVPKIFFQSNLFYPNQPEQQLYQNSLILFQSLKIPTQEHYLTFKRYSNCIFIINNDIVVIWYFKLNGLKYLGGWKFDYLDHGVKKGLGLEWLPEKYVYYGEWVDNKKNGFGAMKSGPEKVTVGYWKNGMYVQNNGRSAYFDNDKYEQQCSGLGSQDQSFVENFLSGQNNLKNKSFVSRKMSNRQHFQQYRQE